MQTKEDIYKISLYSDLSALNSNTKYYTKTNEVVGEGYEVGGLVLQGFDIAYISNFNVENIMIKWETDPEWKGTIRARAALIYNSTKNNKAVCILDFGEDHFSVNGMFKLGLKR